MVEIVSIGIHLANLSFVKMALKRVNDHPTPAMNSASASEAINLSYVVHTENRFSTCNFYECICICAEIHPSVDHC